MDYFSTRTLSPIFPSFLGLLHQLDSIDFKSLLDSDNNVECMQETELIKESFFFQSLVEL